MAPEKEPEKKTAEQEALEKFSPEMAMDYLIRQQENIFTQTKYHFYKLYQSGAGTWSEKQHAEWSTDKNDDGTRKSELFEGVPYNHKYVVAIPETGEWKSFKTRSEVTQNRTGGAMYPYAKWSKHEKARMATYDAVKLITLACSKALPENCDNEVAYLTARDIKEAALMLMSIEEQRREESEVYDEIMDIRSEEE